MRHIEKAGEPVGDTDLLGAHLRYATYLHENTRPYHCFNLDRVDFAALMARVPSSDPAAAMLRDATLRGWPDAPTLPALAAPLADLDHDGLALVQVDGAVLRVDLLDIALSPGTRTLVLDHAGRLDVDAVSQLQMLNRIYGRRATVVSRAADPQDRTDPSGRPIVWAMGTVIEQRDGVAPDISSGSGRPALGRTGPRRAAPTLPAACDLAAIEVCGNG